MNTNKNLLNLVLLALFAGLIFLMGQTPLGLIPLGFCNVTLLVIPVAVGTIYMGWKYGLILGAAFAATSLVSALTKPSALVSTLMGASPALMAVMTILPRLCIPLVIAGVYRLLSKKQHVASAGAAACGSLTNTVLYLGLMLLFYVLCGIDNTKVLTTIAAVAGGAGPLEAIAAAVITPPILTALWRMKK